MNGGDVFANGRKNLLVAIRMLSCLARGAAETGRAGIPEDCLAGALRRVVPEIASFDLRSVAKRVIEMRA